jgi:hypothetical protein
MIRFAIGFSVGDRPERRQRIARPAAVAFGALLFGCQPLPHPFADDRPPAALLKIPGTAAVAIAPIKGSPRPIAAGLGPAMADALLKRDIPATDKTTSRNSYHLYGVLTESRPRDGKSEITAQWRLQDARGRTVGEHRARAEAETGEWLAGHQGQIERLAALSAEGIASLLQDEPAGTAAPALPPVTPSRATAARPAEPAVSAADRSARVRVAIGKLSGAPGDGSASLKAALATVLKRQELTIVEGGGKSDMQIDGEISVAPARRDTQHIKIVWRVRRSDGTEIGTVGQENDIPRGLLDGPWGDVAYSVAIAAGDGIAQLVAHGATQTKP